MHLSLLNPFYVGTHDVFFNFYKMFMYEFSIYAGYNLSKSWRIRLIREDVCLERECALLRLNVYFDKASSAVSSVSETKILDLLLSMWSALETKSFAHNSNRCKQQCCRWEQATTSRVWWAGARPAMTPPICSCSSNAMSGLPRRCLTGEAGSWRDESS